MMLPFVENMSSRDCRFLEYSGENSKTALMVMLMAEHRRGKRVVCCRGVSQKFFLPSVPRSCPRVFLPPINNIISSSIKIHQHSVGKYSGHTLVRACSQRHVLRLDTQRKAKLLPSFLLRREAAVLKYNASRKS